jgi:hypothetical protein
MLAGIIFLLIAILLGTLGLLLPRLGRRFTCSLQEMPKEMLPMISAAAPGMSRMLHIARLLPLLGLVCLGAAAVFGGLGIYAVLAKNIPMALSLFAYVMGAFLAVIGIGLSIVWKRYGSSMLQMGQIMQRMRF